jgi:hypothetical protein
MMHGAEIVVFLGYPRGGNQMLSSVYQAVQHDSVLGLGLDRVVMAVLS